MTSRRGFTRRGFTRRGTIRSTARTLAVPTLVAVISLAFCALSFSPAAHAGGWAVTSLDPLPPIEVGKETPVGFTILQHGSRPAEGLTDVSITTTLMTTGDTETFTATESGPPGHYVAVVIFRTAGTYDWSVQPGWFATQSLGSVTVGAPTTGASSPAATSGSSAPSPTTESRRGLLTVSRIALPLVAIGFALFTVPVVLARRRRPMSPA